MFDLSLRFWTRGRALSAWALILCAAVASAIYAAKHFRLESSAESLVLDGDPDLRFYQQTRTYFSSDEFVLCALQAEDHFTPAGVDRLERLTRALEELPGIEQVLSATRVPLFFSRRADAAENRFAAAVRNRMPRTLLSDEIDLDRAREELSTHRIYRNSVVSSDGQIVAALAFLKIDPVFVELAHQRTAIQGELEQQALPAPRAKELRARLAELQPRYLELEKRRQDERFAIVADVRNVLASFEKEVQAIHASGVPVVVVDIVNALESDLLRMGLTALGLALLYLYLVTRSLRYVVLTFALLFTTLATTFAIFFATGRSLTIVSANAPSLIALMGFAHALHLFVRQRELLAHDPTLDVRAAFLRSARALWRPCFWTVTTTAAGFGSLSLAGIRPVEDYGIACTLGVALAFVFSFVLLPLAAIAFPARQPRITPMAKKTRASLEHLGSFAQRWRVPLLALFALVAVVASFGIPRLEVETRFIDYFSKHTQLYRDFEFLDRRMGGTMNLEIVVSSREGSALRSEEKLAMLGRMDEWLQARSEMGSASSLYDFAAETARVLPGEGGLLRTLGVLGGILGEAKLRFYRSADERHLRVMGRVHESRANLDRRGLLRDLDLALQGWRSELDALGLEARATGMFLLYTNVLDSLLRSQTQTMLLTVFLVFLMLTLALRSVRLGFIGLLPNAFTILIALGTMGWLGVHLDIATVMLASVTFGLAVDATIHYLHRMRQERLRGRHQNAALLRAHSTIGVSIFHASAIAAFAFAVYALSNFRPNITFGLATGAAMAVGLAATLIALPALLTRARASHRTSRRPRVP